MNVQAIPYVHLRQMTAPTRYTQCFKDVTEKKFHTLRSKDHVQEKMSDKKLFSSRDAYQRTAAIHLISTVFKVKLHKM